MAKKSETLRVLLVIRDLSGFDRLGIMSLSAALNKAGYVVRLVVEENTPYEEIARLTTDFQPGTIGYSVMTGEHRWLVDLNRKLKKDFQFISVFGGTHPTFFPHMIDDEEDVDAICVGEGIERIKPDAVIIASFPKIIPDKTLHIAKFINVHHGDLPRQRGRANVNWAIINGEPNITVTIHEAVSELDAGDIIKQFTTPIKPNDEVGDVYDKLNEYLGATLGDACFEYLTGIAALTKQVSSGATYYGTRLPQDGLIDWRWSRDKIRNLVRALAPPFPGAYTYLNEKKLTIWKVAEPESPRIFEGFVAGRIVGYKKGVGVEIHAGDGILLLREVEIGDFRGDPAEILRSSQITLGLDLESLLLRISTLESRID